MDAAAGFYGGFAAVHDPKRAALAFCSAPASDLDIPDVVAATLTASMIGL